MADETGSGVAPIAPINKSTTIKIGPSWSFSDDPISTALSMISSAACAYHGYKRNGSFGWGLGWGLLGGMFPIITPTIAVAQGFGKPSRDEVKLAALGTNEFTEGLPEHLRAMLAAEREDAALQHHLYGHPHPLSSAWAPALTPSEQMALLDAERGE